MARTRRLIATRFLKRFEEDRPTHELAAQQASDLISEVLVNSPALIHALILEDFTSKSFKLKDLAGVSS
jgi:hypothetical protein